MVFSKIQDKIIALNEEAEKYDFSPKGVENDANSFKLIDYLVYFYDALLEIAN
jgi:hypothetical protein